MPVLDVERDQIADGFHVAVNLPRRVVLVKKAVSFRRLRPKIDASS
jgi:hypothetical protein